VLTIEKVLLLAAACAAALMAPAVAGADGADPVVAVASISATGSTAQEAVIGEQFGAPLQVRVLDAWGTPVQGATVAFALGNGTTGAGASFLGGGAQASATSNASGIATSPPILANGSPGRFVATASTADIPAVVQFALINHAATTRIAVTGGSSQHATTGGRFPHRLRVRVLGSDQQPIEGATVTFSLSHADGGAGASFPDGGTQATALTDAAGLAASPPLTAMVKAGSFSATASTPAVTGVAIFRLRSVAGRPAAIAAGAAGGQVAVASTRFRIPLAVTISDANANPVANATVTFSAPSGGPRGGFGTRSRPTVHVRTNALGIAVAPTFTANDTPGGYAVVARVAGTRLRVAFALVNEQGA
jgi:hypothetical protein